MNTDPAKLAKVLKRCPFCGSLQDDFAGLTEGAFARGSDGTLSVNCNCGAIGPSAKTMEGAIGAWNNRQAATLLEQMANTMTAEEVRVPLDLFKRPTEYAEEAAGGGYGGPSEKPGEAVEAEKGKVRRT